MRWRWSLAGLWSSHRVVLSRVKAFVRLTRLKKVTVVECGREGKEGV